MGVVDLSGRSALVVGAGKGIGRATALVLGAAGARVIVLDRHSERAESVADEIRSAGGAAQPQTADVTQADRAQAAVREADRVSGGLDIVVNITGSASWLPLVETDGESWDRDFRVNLDHHLAVSRSAARLWIERGRPGAVCVVGSISGVFGAGGHAGYGAAKAALHSFVRSAGEEWWPYGIRVNAVVPGSVRTPRIEAQFPEDDARRPLPEMVARMASPEEVAGPIAFLVSGLSAKVTGQTLIVDGGTSSRFPYALSD